MLKQIVEIAPELGLFVSLLQADNLKVNMPFHFIHFTLNSRN
jgi:hypothetical protein